MLKWLKHPIALIGVGFLIGVLVTCAMETAKVVAVDGKINAGNLLQAFVTLAAALLVTFYLQRRAATDRKEKDIVLRYWDLAIDTVNQLEERQHTGELSAIQSSLKKLSSNCRSAVDLCAELRYDVDPVNQTGIDDLVKQVRRLSTGTVANAADEVAHPDLSGATVENGIISLNSERAELLGQRIHQLRMRLLRAQVEVNKAERRTDGT